MAKEQNTKEARIEECCNKFRKYLTTEIEPEALEKKLDSIACWYAFHLLEAGEIHDKASSEVLTLYELRNILK